MACKDVNAASLVKNIKIIRIARKPGRLQTFTSVIWTKILLLQMGTDNQGNQNGGQVPDLILSGFKIFWLLVETGKATGFRSLHLNYWEFNQVT